MNNVESLRKELSEVFAGLKSGEIKPKQAAEMNNTAGKMIQSVKVQLDYYALRKETPVIEFLKTSQ